MVIGKSYIITGRERGTIKVTYYLDGILESVIFSHDCTDMQRRKMLSVVESEPQNNGGMASIDEYMKLLKKNNVPVQEIPADISFDRFYDIYGVKKNRKRALAAWNKTSIEKRTLAILGIPKFKAAYLAKNWKLPLPEKYLSDERYTDE